MSVSDYAQQVQAVLTNGIEKIGFTHHSDPGLPAAYHLVIPYAQPTEAGAAVGAEDLHVVRNYIGAIQANVQVWEQFIQDKNIPTSLADAMRPLCLAIRGATVVYAATGTESVYSAGVMSNVVTDYAKQAATIPIGKAALWVVVRAVNYVNTNHCTSGNVLPKAQLALLRSQFHIGFSDDDVRNVTNCMYWAMHPADPSWAMNKVMGYNVTDRTVLHRARVTPAAGDIDDWLAMRVRPLPAGTHVLSLYASMCKTVLPTGMLTVAGPGDLLPDVCEAIKAVRLDPMAYHPGAAYWGKAPKEVGLDMGDVKENLAQLAHAVLAISPTNSALQSPAVKTLMANNPAAGWALSVQAIARSREVTIDASFKRAVAISRQDASDTALTGVPERDGPVIHERTVAHKALIAAALARK